MARRILITGGSSGIGAALVRWFVGHGDEVLFTYNRGADRAQRPRRVAHGHCESGAGHREAHAQPALAVPRAGRRFPKLATRVATRDRQRLVRAAVGRWTAGGSDAGRLAVELFD